MAALISDHDLCCTRLCWLPSSRMFVPLKVERWNDAGTMLERRWNDAGTLTFSWEQKRVGTDGCVVTTSLSLCYALTGEGV